MKILHIIDSGGLYGAEMMLLNLTAEQVKMGYCVEIASIGEKGIAEKAIETQSLKSGLMVRKFRMRPGPNLAGALTIMEYAKKKKFDVMHSHGYKGNILLGFWPRSIRRIPMVATLHGYTSTDGFSKMKAYEWLDSISLRFIDKVVLVNQGMLSNHSLKKKHLAFKIINNGISTEINPAGSAIETDLKDFCKNAFIVGALGRLSKEKGFQYLVEAIGKLTQRGKNVRLIILGDGYQRKSLEEKIRMLGISDRVYMPGFKTYAERFFSLFNMLAMPSLTEGLPITILEAMRAGIPIVASRVGGIPFVLENQKSAILVPPADPDALADAIDLFMQHPGISLRLANNAKNVFLNKYTSRQMAQAYHHIYSQIAGSSAKRPCCYVAHN